MPEDAIFTFPFLQSACIVARGRGLGHMTVEYYSVDGPLLLLLRDCLMCD